MKNLIVAFKWLLVFSPGLALLIPVFFHSTALSL